VREAASKKKDTNKSTGEPQTSTSKMSKQPKSPPTPYRTTLSHILSTSAACEILGSNDVRRIIRLFLRFVYQIQRPILPTPKEFSQNVLEERETPDENDEIDLLIEGLMYDFQEKSMVEDVWEGKEMESVKRDSALPTPPRPPPNSTSPSSTPNAPPASVTYSWSKLLNRTPVSHYDLILGIDKSSFLSSGTLFPPTAVPHRGVNGHYALMDCLFQALSTPAPTLTSPKKDAKEESKKKENHQRDMYTMAKARTMILLPDLLIFFAIVRQALAPATSLQYKSALVSLFSFRIYDSYQKRGVLTRDTLHRFMSDVHGEDSFKTPHAKAMLDALFRSDGSEDEGMAKSVAGIGQIKKKEGSTKKFMTQLTLKQYTRGMYETLTPSDTTTTSPLLNHVLFDWIIQLGNAMLPPSPIPTSTLSYHSQMESTDPEKALHTLCTRYHVKEEVLYEVKRRYHSIVLRFQREEKEEESESEEEEHHLPIEEEEGQADRTAAAAAAAKHYSPTKTTTRATPMIVPTSSSFSVEEKRPRNVIDENSFITAVSEVKEEMGWGGYLPVSLAKLTFRGGCDKMLRFYERKRFLEAEEEEDAGTTPYYWTMYDALSFGCDAVRGDVLTIKGTRVTGHDVELELLKFIFETFLRLPDSNREEKDVLTRYQIGQMLVLLMEHSNFRLSMDSPPGSTAATATATEEDEKEKEWEDGLYGTEEKEEEGVELTLTGDVNELASSPPSSPTGVLSSKKEKEDGNDDDLEHKMVDVSSASLLGLVPPDIDLRELNTITRTTYSHMEQNGGSDSDSQGGRKHGKVSQRIPLGLLIDYVLKEASYPCKVSSSSSMSLESGVVCNDESIEEEEIDNEEKEGEKTKFKKDKHDCLSFHAFLRWYYKSSDKEEEDNPKQQQLLISQRRIGPYLLDLRLISSILFGVKPSSPSMELLLINEVKRRHQYRYPACEGSGRGPLGTVWYVTNADWIEKWTKWASSSSSSSRENQTEENKEDEHGDNEDEDEEEYDDLLGKIDNNMLLEENGRLALKSSLTWRVDFELIPPLAWSALQAWHDGGPPIHRTVVSYKPSNADAKQSNNSITKHEIELYPFFVTVFLCDSTSRGEARPFQQYVPLSRFLPIRVFLMDLCRSLDMDIQNCRLWMMKNVTWERDSVPMMDYDWLMDPELNVVEQTLKKSVGDGIADSDMVLTLELRDEKDGTWPRGVDGKKKHQDMDEKNGVQKDEVQMGDGIVGLYNMGNTCYLNSSIQCLSHTPIFRDYFTSKSYLNDINRTNPLGQQGRLAQVSAVLINSLWKRFNQQPSLMGFGGKKITQPGSFTPINAPALTPKSFKEALGKFSDHFAGNEQHDAQELLAFLLSGLSEDLNQIVDKPYIEAPDSDGRPDKELADIWWSNHLKREMSIIVALFTGQYKSLLTCRSCKYESARFEPFAFLQLPLPEDDQISVQLILYPIQDERAVMKYSVRVRHDGTIKDLLASLAKVLHADMIEDEKLSQEQKSTDPEKDDTSKGVVADEKEDKESDYKEESSVVPNNDEGQEDVESSADVDVETSDNDGEQEEEKSVSPIHLKMAHNLAVVDVGDGYIHKIVPQNWSLTKLQNRDTGEMPLITVHELEQLPTPEVEYANNEKKNISNGQRCELNNNSPKSGVPESTTSDKRCSSPDKVDDDNENKVPPPDTTGADQNDSANPVQNDSANPVQKEEEKQPQNGDKTQQTSPDADHKGKPVPKSPQRVVSDIKYSYLAVAQRKMELINGSLLHPFAQRVFGTPLLLRVADLEGYTGVDLYDLIAKRMKRYAPDGAFHFLSKGLSAASNGDYSLRHEDDNQSLTRNGGRMQRQKTLADMEEVSAGDIPRYGFRLRLVSRDGKRCPLCAWFDCCIGCLIPDDNSPTIVMCGDSIAVDWHMAVELRTSGFGFRIRQGDKIRPAEANGIARASLTVKKHRSCGGGGNKYGYNGCITLEECLDSFAKEEKIPEAYCSKCKEFRVQTKRMSLWRLPPVMIIHLKRFQFTQHMRRKLRDLVMFPLEGLDFSRIIASSDCDTKQDARANGKIEVDVNGEARSSDQIENDVQKDTEKKASLKNGDDGRSESLYDLYGVVHHQGALSGGHYVASLKSELDGKWRLFNDAQIYDISSRDVVDPSAYILFYIRRDVKNATLEDFWDVSTREGEGMTEEEVEKMMKSRERCIIS